MLSGHEKPTREQLLSHMLPANDYNMLYKPLYLRKAMVVMIVIAS